MQKKTIAIMVIVISLSVFAALMWTYTRPAPFSMNVMSRPRNLLETQQEITALVDQDCVFLIVVSDGDGSWMQGTVGLGEEVELLVTSPSNMIDVSVYPEIIFPGEVAEIHVIPSVASVNNNITITVTGKRQGLVQTKILHIHTIEGEHTLGPQAQEIVDRFIDWLENNYPEFYITNETTFTGTIVNPKILVVMHYLFFSDEWEIYVTWHVTIPPNDWARIYLRYRFFELSPSYAFEISSIQTQEEPHLIEVPDWV